MPSETSKIFATRLQALIADSSLSFNGLADNIGVSRAALSKYQNDNAEPGITALVKIAEYFEVTTDYLLGLEDCTTHTNTDISKEIGLNESAISALAWLTNIPTGGFPSRYGVYEGNARLLTDVGRNIPGIRAPLRFDDVDFLNFFIANDYLDQFMETAVNSLNAMVLRSVIPTDTLPRDKTALPSVIEEGFSRVRERSDFILWKAEKELVELLDGLCTEYLNKRAGVIEYMDISTAEQLTTKYAELRELFEGVTVSDLLRFAKRENEDGEY